MTAGVIDGLETIEVEVAQHVTGIATMSDVDSFLQAALELASVDQPGERIVRRLVGDLPGQAAGFGDVMQLQHSAINVADLIADGCRCEFYQTLRDLLIEHQRAAPKVDRQAG